MSAADGGVHRRRGTGVVAQRVGLGVLLAGIAAATIAIPPLITPDGRHAATPSAPATTSVPSPSATATATTATAATARSTPPAPAACVPAGAGVVAVRPSCGIYRTGLGNGWTALGDGLKIIAGQVVPGSHEAAMRVERTRPALPHTTMTLSAATPIGVTDGSRLQLRVWGGRQFGTVLRLSVAPSTRAPVTLTAPADRWTDFRVVLADLGSGRSLSRITLAVAADQVPNVNRFFLDDITITS